MDDADALLARADARHDDDAPAAGADLRRLALGALSPGRRPRAAFLFNHVLGEHLGDWHEAQRHIEALAALACPQAPHLLWRQAGAAAHHAGDAPARARHAQSLATAAAAPLAQAVELIELAALSFALAGREAGEAAVAARAALAPLDTAGWQRASPLDADAAALCNNIAGHFADRPLADLALPALREALATAARLSEDFWWRAGGWVQRERACYLRALASHALHAPADALQHAQRGVALLDEHDHGAAETIDRAFLTLEMALAHRRLGQPQQAAQAQAAAEVLLRGVGDDAGLQRWFDERIARNAMLATVRPWS